MYMTMLRPRNLLMIFVLSANVSLWFFNVTFLMKRGDSYKREVTSPPIHQQIDKRFKVKTFYPDIRNIRYILNNMALCNISKSIALLYVVSSSTKHFDHRKNIRSTFANSSYFKNYTVRVVFFLGKPNGNGFTQRKIEEEHRKYGDVIQGDFLDVYRNLTLKVLTEFHWIAHYCPNVVAIGKIDDDTFVDTVKFLTTYLSLFKIRKKYILCNSHRRVVVERKGRWSVPSHELKSYYTYPWKYCSGYAVFLKGDIIANLLKASLVSPFLWVDDVYFSGILPSWLTGIDYKKVQNRVSRRTDNVGCFMNKSCVDVFGTVLYRYFPKIWNFTINERYRGLKF